MSPSTSQVDLPTSSMPNPAIHDFNSGPSGHHDTDLYSSAASSRSGSTSDTEGVSSHTPQRPKLHTRKSSGTIIVPSHVKVEGNDEEDYAEGDARTMSPRRSSEEVDKLERGAKQAMIEQAKQLQASLLSICERVDSVKAEHEKLEGGNKFLQSYIGELMQTSKITSAGAAKSKGKGRVK